MRAELSVIIPAHDCRELVVRCIEALARQTADPALFEVIVADDGSTDDTSKAVNALETPFRLRTLALPRRGRAVTRNAGIEAAQGKVCLFIDADVIPDREVVAEHLAAHSGDRRVIGFGKLVQAVPEGRDWYAEAYARSIDRHFSELEAKPATWEAGYGGNLSAARSALIEVGGFDEGLVKNEDIDLAYRLWRHGAEPRYLPNAGGIHDDAKDSRGLLRAIVLNAEGYRVLIERHPAMLHRLYGWFSTGGPRELVVRRILIALRLPPRVLVALGNVVPARRREEAYDYVSRYAFWLAARRTMKRDLWLRITRGVPVLMYHAFDQTRTSDRYVVSRRAFAAQMRVLRALRYRVITFSELATSMRESRLPPRRAVALTFDDGYRDSLLVAQPILRRHGFPATHFLVSGRLGGHNDWTGDGALERRPLISIDEALALQGDGGEIGGHTRTHPRLPEVDDRDLADEIAGCRRDLEAQFGPVGSFAYPHGSRDARAVSSVADAGYLAACTTEPRRVRLDDDPLQLPRIEIRGGDSLPTFLRKLWRGGA